MLQDTGEGRAGESEGGEMRIDDVRLGVNGRTWAFTPSETESLHDFSREVAGVIYILPGPLWLRC